MLPFSGHLTPPGQLSPPCAGFPVLPAPPLSEGVPWGARRGAHGFEGMCCILLQCLACRPRAPGGASRRPLFSVPLSHEHTHPLLTLGLTLVVFGSVKSPCLDGQRLAAAGVTKARVPRPGPQQPWIPLLQIINLAPCCITSEKAFRGELPPVGHCALINTASHRALLRCGFIKNLICGLNLQCSL